MTSRFTTPVYAASLGALVAVGIVGFAIRDGSAQGLKGREVFEFTQKKMREFSK